MPRTPKERIVHALCRALWDLAKHREGCAYVLHQNHGRAFFADVFERLQTRERMKGGDGSGTFFPEVLEISSATALERHVKELERIGILMRGGRPVSSLTFQFEYWEKAQSLLSQHFPLKKSKALDLEQVIDVRVRDRLLQEERLRKAQEAEKRAEGGTVLVVDFENAMKSLGCRPVDFPSAGIIERVGKQCPPLTMSVLFYGEDRTSKEEMQLQRAGFLLVRCPLRSADEPDTVDATITHFVREMFIPNEKLTQIVLFSGDHGYAGLVAEVRGAEKEFYLLGKNRYAQGLSRRELLTAVGEECFISLDDEERGDPYLLYRNAMRDIRRIGKGPKDPTIATVLQIAIAALPRIASPQSGGTKLRDMADAIWDEVRREGMRGRISEHEIRGAVRALKSAGILIRVSDDRERFVYMPLARAAAEVRKALKGSF